MFTLQYVYFIMYSPLYIHNAVFTQPIIFCNMYTLYHLHIHRCVSSIYPLPHELCQMSTLPSELYQMSTLPCELYQMSNLLCVLYVISTLREQPTLRPL